ncbi:riboflavin synthase [Viridibacillus sp. YIM B01967]|uniref:Riboflavin synthase n=1 Tax=Viridibacillus soli TaxID=2798301 RepID=A0ABS1HCB0_9BACL|nr:riboflavin synthase [Viridibacillus soli]MBK3497042.1 riboflavin synthase [Viridibacillus soli]
MFTGIIEAKGKITAMTKDIESMKLTVEAHEIMSDIGLGDSVAVNGICLTVSHFTKHDITLDVMSETVKATTIQAFKIGHVVNLERAITANGRFGGHFVSGHVDGTGTIIKKTKQANAIYIDISIARELSQFCIPRGSIAIDGTSLTIFDKQTEKLTVSLIPHTYRETIFALKEVGQQVNIETDMLGKYIVHQLKNNDGSSTITMDFLQQNGY